jgi:putative ABC transport system permease protein
MSVFREWLVRLRDTVRPRRTDADLHEELRAHLDMAGDARRVSTGSAMEALREQRGISWLADLVRDGRYAWRGFRRTPGLTTVGILTLALGTGANTAIFSLINAIMLRPLPVRAPEELVELLSVYPDPAEPRHNTFAWKYYERLRDETDVFSALIAMSPAPFRIAVEGPATDEVRGQYVTGSFFPALGLQPAVGRLISTDDDRLDSPSAVAVLSWSYWQRRFNRDPAVLGARITLNGVPTAIVGVAPPSFVGLYTGLENDVWVPVAMETLIRQPSHRADGSLTMAVFGRLKRSVSRDQARAQLVTVNRRRVEEIARNSRDPRWLHATLEVVSARSGGAAIRDRFGSPLFVLMAAVAALLAIACTNLAGLLLARGAARQREIVLRLSLGAGRGRLVRQVLTEGLLLSFIGSTLGIVVAYLGATALMRALLFQDSRIPIVAIHVTPDIRVLVFTISVALATGLACALAPAWQAVSFAPVSTLREIGAVGEPRWRRLFGRTLVIAQVALSAALLSGGGMFVRHLANLRSVDLGFARDSVLVVSVDPAGSGYNRYQLSGVYRDLLTRFEAIPGVTSATLSAVTPIEGGGALRFATVDGFNEAPDARRYISLNWVAPKYFATLGTPLIAGRDFQYEDAQRPRVAIVNQSMARYYFGDASALGRHVRLEGEDQPYEIVGVVGDAKYSDLRLAAPRTMYCHAFQEGHIGSRFTLRTTVNPMTIAPAIQQYIRESLKTVRIARVTTLADQMDASIVTERVVALLAAWFGGLGVLLAAIGLYGLLAYAVVRRTNEIGIRMALGATESNVTLMVVRSALALVVTGLLVAVPLTVWSQRVARALADLPPGTSVPRIFTIVLMIAVGLLAAYLPARRAAAISPLEALRHQ